MPLMKCTNEQKKDTGLAITLILLIIVFLTANIRLVPLAIIALVICMSWPPFFSPVAPLWFGFSHFLGNIVSKILLSIIFILVVLPVGLFRRLLGKDSMRLKIWKSDSSSVFVDRDHTYVTKDLEFPY